jgi:hypothetical protein
MFAAQLETPKQEQKIEFSIDDEFLNHVISQI